MRNGNITLVTLVASLVLLLGNVQWLVAAEAAGANRGAAQNPADSEKQLEQLAAEMAKVVPQGWTVELWPTSKGERTWYPYQPGVVVSRREKALGNLMVPNPPPGEEAPRLTDVVFLLLCTPYVSEEQFRRLAQENAAIGAARLEFQQKLKGIKSGFMGPNPIPPGSYHPANDAERALLREYAFLWNNATPRDLPDYYYQGLSFKAHMMDNFRAAQTGDQKEIQAVREKVLQIVKRYEP